MNVEFREETDYMYSLPPHFQAMYAEEKFRNMSTEDIEKYVEDVSNNLPGPCQLLSGQTVANLSYIYNKTCNDNIHKILFNNYSEYITRKKNKTKKLNTKFLGIFVGVCSVLGFTLYKKYR